LVENLSRRWWSLAILLAAPVLLLIMQTFGSAATDAEFHPLFDVPDNLYPAIIRIVVLLSVISPVTSAAALVVAIRLSRTLPVRVPLLVICAAFAATSWAGCAWTFSGHPTWTTGYSGRR